MARIYLDDLTYEKFISYLNKIEVLAKEIDINNSRPLLAEKIIKDYKRVFSMLETYQQAMLGIQLDIMNGILEVSRMNESEELLKTLEQVKSDIDNLNRELRRFKTLFKDKIGEVNQLDFKVARAKNVIAHIHEYKDKIERILADQQNI